jgi:hypothetical protein
VIDFKDHSKNVHFGLFTDQDATRYAYLRLRRLKEAIKEPKVLEALARELEVTGVDATSPAKTLAAIERQIGRLRAEKTSLWFGVPAPEILAAAIFKAGFKDGEVAGGPARAFFTPAPRDEELAPPVLNWLKGSGLTTVEGVPFGGEPIDVVGYRKGLLSGPRVVAVAMKNDPRQLEHALEALKSLAPYTNVTYLACTPAVAASYLAAYAAAQAVPRWDGDALNRRLRASGLGLLVVEGDAVSQALLAKERHLDLAKVNEFVATMTRT